ncbi:MAG: hypothetical protein DSY90_13665 [Deltaproteobacteria bacterium]|nr:MAG: hypothetical protein DSY90_13665 [Deltaproteobacteria bacterium]
MKRRDFLKLAGMGSISFAASACTSETDKMLYSLVEAPGDMVTGSPAWYASTCRECPAGCGILVKNREGRAIKVEGNPLHPVNRGKLCIRGQAVVQGVYNPDRIRTPLVKKNGRWRPVSFSRARTILTEKAFQAAQGGTDRVRMLTELVGDSQMSLLTRCLKQLHSRGPVVFEPLAYETLRTANREVFGIDGLPAYRMERADCLVSLGADFLETWLSPVEYAWRFKAMHAVRPEGKGIFFHISPYQSLTGANADRWIACDPGREAAVVMGLIKAALEQGRGAGLPKALIQTLRDASGGYTPKATARMAGIDSADFEGLAIRLLKAKAPLILGTGVDTGGGAFPADLAANLLNLVLDPALTLFDFDHRHRMEQAARRSDVLDFLTSLRADAAKLLLIHNADPVYALAADSKVRETLTNDRLFVASFSNFMDDTTALADLILPVSHPLESWDEYSGKNGIISTVQPAMGPLTPAPQVGDLMMDIAFDDQRPAPDYKSWVMARLHLRGIVREKSGWLKALQTGGMFSAVAPPNEHPHPPMHVDGLLKPVSIAAAKDPARPVFAAVPSIRFFDGRGGNRPWLCEIPDPLTKVAWQAPVLGHPETFKAVGAGHGEIVEISTRSGQIRAIAYITHQVKPGLLVMSMGQGHHDFGRYAKNAGINPLILMPPEPDKDTGAPVFFATAAGFTGTGDPMPLAHTDGSRIQHGRKIALTVELGALRKKERMHEKDPARPTADETARHETSLTMDGFPLTLPLPEGYDPKRDFYPPHAHDHYRWAMVVDLDKCIGCAACAAACYAENNIGIVGKDRIIEGREMAWLRIERYHDPDHPEKVIFFPMMCQQCDNAPCEPVCPVYAPHHSREGLNNQIYNRCIGTRFCSQNCPYKVRRFNWFEWKWPAPLQNQLNPDVTVRSKGVMEKCSFCVQRIKVAHGRAKDEKREIKDGEVVPACVQTCPTGALTFGNLMDVNSRVRMLTGNRRAYQAMGYLNTKPAVIYLKKVILKG